MRAPLLLASGLLLGLAACDSTSDPMADWTVGTGPSVPVSGKAFVFGPSSGLTLEGATVRVAEDPSLATTIAADGTFAFEVPSGAPVTLQVVQDGFHLNQSAALDLGATGLADVGFQVPTEGVFGLLANMVGIDADPATCQISTTVSRAGTEPYGGSGLGEPGVVVTIDPPLSAEHGPVYFQYVSESYIYPEPMLTSTTIDGGVIFTNVPPGEYTLHGTKEGKQFTDVVIRCRAGVLVNAAPPHGIQEL